MRTDNRIPVTLLGLVPPPNGGIASWTMRMLNSSLLSERVELGLVNEVMPKGRATFGRGSKRTLRKEVKRCLRIWSDLKSDLVSRESKVVHSNIPAFPLSMLREIVCALIAKRYHAKFLIHFRCTVPVAAKGVAAKALLRIILLLADGVIVLNRASEDYIAAISSVPVFLVPNFVSDGELNSSNGRSAGQIKTALYAGGIIPEKGVDDIVSLARLCPDISFVLAGQGEIDGADLKNVHMLGSLTKEELASQYEHADVFIFLSRFKGEGFSNSLAEAMSAGLPCIVTDWAANADMVGNNGGIIVESHDLRAMVNAISALNDVATREAMGARNRAKASRDYSESAVISKYIDIYDRLSVD